ncbi:hypothetical protein BDN67DRAFT_270388 [Paxillus ammoniavirescens]|nr:hypothetical protein BDN67DRAFT_270388 [Paxillus ammoniavirescens]
MKGSAFWAVVMISFSSLFARISFPRSLHFDFRPPWLYEQKPCTHISTYFTHACTVAVPFQCLLSPICPFRFCRISLMRSTTQSHQLLHRSSPCPVGVHMTCHRLAESEVMPRTLTLK